MSRGGLIHPESSGIDSDELTATPTGYLDVMVTNPAFGEHYEGAYSDSI